MFARAVRLPFDRARDRRDQTQTVGDRIDQMLAPRYFSCRASDRRACLIDDAIDAPALLVLLRGNVRGDAWLNLGQEMRRILATSRRKIRRARPEFRIAPSGEICKIVRIRLDGCGGR
jgi:hypothetical protein